ncbi:MAG: hypothetical protein GC162_05125 [Planctomycetes bacterium]|nr:hypothetical protein [Planctomycetota bacterium]
MRCAKLVTTGLILSAASLANAANIADFRDDFSGTAFPTGWQYLWNAPLDWNGSSSSDASTNPLGTSANYVALNPVSGTWRADNDTLNNNGFPADFLLLTSTGGHPGRGSTQSDGIGNNQDRAPIAAYTLQAGDAGPVYLTNTLLQGTNPTHTGTLRALVYVNDTLVVNKVQTALAPISFDAALGNLNVGDTVYVAVSPDGADGSDGFALDFTLSHFANSVNGPIVVADLHDDYKLSGSFADGTQASFANLGTGWAYLWNAPADWDGTTSSDGSTGAITSIADFEFLKAGGGRWSPDGDALNNDGPPSRYLNTGNLSGSLVSGHPGAGFTQGEGIGNNQDRYVIYAYTIDTDGLYEIIDSHFSTGDAQGDGNNVRVFTSLDALTALFDTTFAGVTDAHFNTALGFLSAGDVVYVAVGVGSNGNDSNDSYNIDYAIAAVPTPAALPAGLALMGMILVRRRK